MFDFLFLVLSLPFFALAWRGVEWIVFQFVRPKHNAPRYVTLIYDVLAVGGGIVLALAQIGTVGIAFVNVEPYSIGDLFFIALIGYLVYNLFTPLTRRHREVWLHHAFVGGILFIAIVWGYPSTVLPLWLLVELTELVAQMRYFMQGTRWERFGIRFEYWVRVVKLFALAPLFGLAHLIPWYRDAPLWVAAIYFLLAYYLMWMYIYEVRLSYKRATQWRAEKG
ncbi:MAG: hypothetical protein HZB51_22010 [Chloroflexi bacterium]|nr:hypothetical protein [Chloroflexota bacterium]